MTFGLNMDVEFITVWAVLLGGDDRSPGSPGEWYSSESAASIAAKNRGWYGGDASIKDYPAVKIHSEVYVLRSSKPVDLDLKKAEHKERVKQAALGKLSPEEKTALGL